MPVLPEVPSMIVAPGFNNPAFSASSIIFTAIRSLIELPGLKVSILASTVASTTPLVIELMRTNGVLPMASRMLSQIVRPGAFDTARSYLVQRWRDAMFRVPPSIRPIGLTGDLQIVVHALDAVGVAGDRHRPIRFGARRHVAVQRDHAIRRVDVDLQPLHRGVGEELGLHRRGDGSVGDRSAGLVGDVARLVRRLAALFLDLDRKSVV